MNNVLQLIRERSIEYDDADFLSNIFGFLKDRILKKEIPIVLYGAGDAGKQMLPIFKAHGVVPIGFCDTNSAEIGNSYCEVPLFSFDELMNEHRECVVVITNGKFGEEIRYKLVKAGFSYKRIIIIEPKHLTYYSNITRIYFTNNDLIQNEQRISQLFSWLNDEKSKELFLSRMALFVRGADYRSFSEFIYQFAEIDSDCSGRFYYSNSIFETVNYGYFNSDLLKLENGEVLVDAGAFNGDTISEFDAACKKNNVSYEKVYGFEPDKENYLALIKSTEKNKNQELVNRGLYSRTTVLNFEESTSSASLGAGTARIVDSNLAGGFVQIKTTSLDEFLGGDKVTFIKMDIEGAELEALRGASNTIKQYKPKLAISVYHERDDILEIPCFIKELCPEYKFYLRHYSNFITETVLFATV